MTKIAVDLGRSGIRIYIKDRDITVREPSVAAIRLSDSGVCAVGASANRVFAKTPGVAQKLLPLADDYISNFDAVTAILGKHIKRAGREPHSFLISVGNPISENEKEKIREVLTEKFGGGTVEFTPSVYVAALGCRLPYSDGKYRMSAELSAYATTVVIMKGMEALKFFCIRRGSAAFDLAVSETLHDRFGIKVNDAVAERIKKGMVSLEDGGNGKVAEISGISVGLGLPKTVRVSSGDFSESVRPAAESMIRALRSVTSQLPPEAWRDVYEEGILLTGGAVIDGFAERVGEATGMNVLVAEDPEGLILAGMKKMLEESVPAPRAGNHIGVITTAPARGSKRYDLESGGFGL